MDYFYDGFAKAAKIFTQLNVACRCNCFFLFNILLLTRLFAWDKTINRWHQEHFSAFSWRKKTKTNGNRSYLLVLIWLHFVYVQLSFMHRINQGNPCHFTQTIIFFLVCAHLCTFNDQHPNILFFLLEFDSVIFSDSHVKAHSKWKKQLLNSIF